MLNVDTAAMTTDQTDVDASTEVALEVEIDVTDFDNEPKTQTDIWAPLQSMQDMVYGLPSLCPENENLRFDVE